MKITISYDDVQYEHYRQIIENIIETATPLYRDKNIIQNPNNRNNTEMVVLRDGKIDRGGFVHFDYEDMGYTLLSEIAISPKLRLLVKHHEEPHAPIQVLGNNGIYTLEKTYESNPWIIKAIDHAKATEKKADGIKEREQEKSLYSSDTDHESSNLGSGNNLGS